MVRSLSILQDAIIFSVGWHDTDKTTSREREIRLCNQKLPLCPCNFSTSFFDWRSQIYIHLSSLPDTIYLFSCVTEKAAEQQYLEFSCPLYILTHLPVVSCQRRNIPSMDEESIYFPLGEKLMNDTGALWSWSTIVFKHCPFPVSQILL